MYKVHGLCFLMFLAFRTLMKFVAKKCYLALFFPSECGWAGVGKLGRVRCSPLYHQQHPSRCGLPRQCRNNFVSSFWCILGPRFKCLWIATIGDVLWWHNTSTIQRWRCKYFVNQDLGSLKTPPKGFIGAAENGLLFTV